jgi:tetratricopeptide (TPR) repeat protein
VRISAHLIDAENGNQIWADRFDRELVDIFSLQDEITETIVGTIEQQLGSIERSRALRKRTEDLKSWDLFQRGLFYVWQMTGDSLAEGAGMLRKSLESDPTFAEAHAWISFTFLHQVYLNTTDNLDATIAAAREHAQQAITYDENLDLGHEMVARIFIFEQRYEEAVAAAERAVQLNPNSTSANFSLGVVLIFADRFDEALAPTQRAMRLSPKDHRRANHLNSLGIVLSETGRLDEGIEALREAVSLQHEDYRSALWLARYASEAGQIEEANRAAAIVMKLNPEFSLSRLPTTFGTTFTAAYIERFMPHVQELGFPE